MEHNYPSGTSVKWKKKATLARYLCQVAERRGRTTWKHILREQVSRAFCEENPTDLKEDLREIILVCRLWIESIDRGKQAYECDLQEG